ncbi:TPA: MFS transporter [Enterococcus faecium]|uniref:MFS transporter n=1 Tax=Enterococcus faecium TaxID=1352 RepID=UPI00298F2C0E|nr:MFS transporter [Enterococcus faecium]MDW7869588.1 MFS transporter [Enterococcus faecium]HCR3722818.1 MFS transporter [Enterococcus faecium]
MERKFGLRDKIGYMFGDFGNDFTFIFASSFLMIFYTKVLGISGATVGTLFLVARFIDAVTDITMGRIVDGSKPSKTGKFKPWILRMSGPVALASFLMYQTSMASAITSVAEERTALSTFRSIGATLAGMFIGVLTPIFIYTRDSSGAQIVRGGSTFTIVAGVFSVCAVICYVICYKLTVERVKSDESQLKVSLLKSLKGLAKNRALLSIIAAAIFLLLAQLLTMSMNNYVFPDYYNNAQGIVLMNFINPILMLVLVSPVSLIFSKKYGKKELASVGMFFSAIVYLLLFLIKPSNMYVFLVLTSVGYMGLGIFNTVIWANITDVIDDQEVKSGQREDGTIYAVYSFARKIGQALAGGVGGWTLSIIGYDSLAKVQSGEVLQKLYNSSTLIPAVCFFVVGLILFFVYPLSKEKVLENYNLLNQKHN